jgi:hypothetical protein
LDRSRGNVGEVYNEMISVTKGFNDEEFNEFKEVGVLSNNITSVH